MKIFNILYRTIRTAGAIKKVIYSFAFNKYEIIDISVFIGMQDDKSVFLSTFHSNPHSACMSLEREMRDNRYLENYEKTRKRWQRYAKVRK